MIRTEAEWLKICKGIKGGYTPGGKNENVYLSGHYLVDRLSRWCDPGQPGIRILDWGCGNGRLPMALVDNYPNLDYTGMDIVKPAIDFCHKAFAPWKSYKFKHVNIKNGNYWSKGTINPGDFVLPFDNGSFDVVFCNSLFTHTGQIEIADRFVGEVYRVLSESGVFIATWIIRDTPSYSEAETVYTERMIYTFYDHRFDMIGRMICEEGKKQTEIAARKI